MPANPSTPLRDLIAKIIDPTAWRQHDDRVDMIRIQQEGDRSSPDSESHWQAAATHVVHPSRMKADEIIAALASTDMAGAGEDCAVPPKGWSCTRTPGHDGPCAAVPDDDGLEDEIAEAIDDSLDVDWTGSVGARHVMGLLRAKGIVA